MITSKRIVSYIFGNSLFLLFLTLGIKGATWAVATVFIITWFCALLMSTVYILLKLEKDFDNNEESKEASDKLKEGLVKLYSNKILNTIDIVFDIGVLIVLVIFGWPFTLIGYMIQTAALIWLRNYTKQLL
jgi:hypothetical protein